MKRLKALTIIGCVAWSACAATRPPSALLAASIPASATAPASAPSDSQSLAEPATPSRPRSGENARTAPTQADARPSSGGDATANAQRIPSAQSEPPPTTCAAEPTIKNLHACLPPPTFAKQVCQSAYADVALTMFAKSTPWTRVWLAGDVEAWSASGGFTSRAQLAFDEEVIVLARHASSGGMVMNGGAATFDVLRWDGSCVSVEDGEITIRRPAAPKASLLRWNRLEESTKRALLTSTKIKTSRDDFERACRGDAEACALAEEPFANAIATAVRSGAARLPTPTHRP